MGVKRCAIAAMWIAAIVQGASAQTVVNGWTNLVPQPGSRVVYVSSSSGSDQSSGLRPEAPLRSLAVGYSRLRDGQPDWLVLRRGDTWTEGFSGWQKSASSLTQYMVIGSYGKGDRPRILSGQEAGFQGLAHKPCRGLAIVGIQFAADGLGVSEAAGIEFVQDWGHILVEDCHVEKYKDNIVVVPIGSEMRVTDVRIRRSVIADSIHTGVGHSQGIYLGSCDNWLIEECVLDANGVNRATIFCHNAYIHESCGPGVFRGNISARACSHGVQQRPGGVCENNLMLRNPLGILIGKSAFAPASDNAVRYNVVLDGRDINPVELRAGGIDVSDVSAARVEFNLVAHQRSGGGNISAIKLTRSDNVSVHANVVYQWTLPGFGWGRALAWTEGCGGVCAITDNRFQQVEGGMTVLHEFDSPFGPGYSYANNRYYSLNPLNGYLWFGDAQSFLSNAEWLTLTGEVGAAFVEESFPNPSGTIESYAQSVGLPATLGAFMKEARQQSRQFWRPQFAATEVNRWFRQAFAVYCPADFDRNGFLTSLDNTAFVAAFQVHDPRADINRDGAFNIFDFVDFLGLVSQGCP